MKYIRTKDGRIIDCVKLLEDAKENRLQNEDDFALAHAVLNMRTTSYGWRRRVEKVADSIDELCDAFVYSKCNYMTLDEAIHEKEWEESCLQQDGYPIYGAIWTNNGLIYVAKMNEKGELELL